MTHATLDLIKCESCSTPILNYYTSNKLVLCTSPSCVDGSFGNRSRTCFRELDGRPERPSIIMIRFFNKFSN
jgi:hypothetical protein